MSLTLPARNTSWYGFAGHKQGVSLTGKQLDVSDDGFLSLMADDGETKDDVKVPDGEVGEKIDKLFTTEEKDTSEFCHPNFRRNWRIY